MMLHPGLVIYIDWCSIGIIPGATRTVSHIGYPARYGRSLLTAITSHLNYRLDIRFYNDTAQAKFLSRSRLVRRATQRAPRRSIRGPAAHTILDVRARRAPPPAMPGAAVGSNTAVRGELVLTLVIYLLCILPAPIGSPNELTRGYVAVIPLFGIKHEPFSSHVPDYLIRQIKSPITHTVVKRR